MTPEEIKAAQDKIANFEKFSEQRRHNKMMVDQIKGVPAREPTPESDADPQNPNEK